jgi:hypothetical protein
MTDLTSRAWDPRVAKVIFATHAAYEIAEIYLRSIDGPDERFRRPDRAKFRFYGIPYDHDRPASLPPYWAYILLYDVEILEVREAHVIESLGSAQELTIEDLKKLAERFPDRSIKPTPRREGE